MDVDGMFDVFEQKGKGAAAPGGGGGGGGKGKKGKGGKKGKKRKAEPAAPAAPAAAESGKYDAAVAVAEREAAAAADKRRAKRARKEAQADADVPQKPMSLVPLRTTDIGVSKVEVADCTHEVAIPPGYDFVPYGSEAPPEKPAKEYPFVLDPFQREAVQCIEREESVLVSAHTSAGKTAVAEYAVAMSLRAKQRVIYTSPIKALSNQKYRELQEEFSDVGLMTGDVTINPAASCIVMTTEILRSMLYRGSEMLREIGWVIFDEVHYMRDKERGVVWEETIILLPDNVHYVFLSATIPNALQFARWICYLHKQPCHVVYTEYRPTPLQHYMFPAGGENLHLVLDGQGEFKEGNFMAAMSTMKNVRKGPKNKGKSGGECQRIIKTIMAKGLQPVIVFSFSKRDCETYAMQLSKLDFNTEEEKASIEEIYMNAIDCLSDDDKQLPQIKALPELLKRGIGIHHGGLLPICKEVIEILFGEGLVKVLFATETFAMGLNMPARTVIFTSVRKFDGKEMRYISGGEYIQMSGRAGRRGLDDRGIVIIMVDEKMEPAVAKGLVKGTADELKSAFHLSYNMVLNLLRVEDINPEYLLERSFFQFQNNEAIPAHERRLALLQKGRSAVSIPNEESTVEFYEMKQQRLQLAQELRRYVNNPHNCVPFLVAGRLVRVRDGPDDWGWGPIVNFQEKVKGKRGKTPKAEDKVFVLSVLLNCAPSEAKSGLKPAKFDTGEFKVVPLTLPMIEKISSIRIYLPKDLRPADDRRSVKLSVGEVFQRFPDGIPVLDPVEDMNIKSKDFAKLIKKVESIEARILSHPVRTSEQAEELCALCERKANLTAEIKAVKKQLKDARSIVQLDELKCRKRVLRRMEFSTGDDVIELKGRVACEISTGDELLMTEMMFNGIFNDLTVNQAVALLSCFVFQEKTNDAPRLQEELAGPLRQMHDLARRVATVASECKMAVDQEEYLQSFGTELMDVVYAWCAGKSFREIMKTTDCFEGSVVRALRRLEELLRQLCAAATAIGSTDLENKFSEGVTRIKREIVFAASLYL